MMWWIRNSHLTEWLIALHVNPIAWAIVWLRHVLTFFWCPCMYLLDNWHLNRVVQLTVLGGEPDVLAIVNGLLVVLGRLSSLGGLSLLPSSPMTLSFLPSRSLRCLDAFIC